MSVEDSLNDGYTTYVPKPFHIADLIAAVNHCLQTGRTRIVAPSE